MIRSLIISGLVATSSAVAQAPAARDSVSAAIRDVKYEVTFLRSNGARHEVDVAMTFTTAGTSPVILSLPAWTPGAYEISNFARAIVDFDVTPVSGTNRDLAW